eukprot:12261563-Karenia_brevis.AAC.1
MPAPSWWTACFSSTRFVIVVLALMTDTVMHLVLQCVRYVWRTSRHQMHSTATVGANTVIAWASA